MGAAVIGAVSTVGTAPAEGRRDRGLRVLGAVAGTADSESIAGCSVGSAPNSKRGGSGGRSAPLGGVAIADSNFGSTLGTLGAGVGGGATGGGVEGVIVSAGRAPNC